MLSYRIPKRYITNDVVHIYHDNVPMYISSSLKYDLNTTKNMLEPIYHDNRYTNVSHVLDYCRDLRRIVSSNYNAQNVSNAWLKAYELMSYYRLLDGDSLYYFANCEMPGSFIMAFNHYNRTKLNGRMSWYASSIISDVQRDNSDYLSDKYRLYDRYPDRWLMDNNNDGDTTKISNIDDFCIKLLHKTNGRLVDLYSSDGGTDVSRSYNDQETIDSMLCLGQILGGLSTLRCGGCFVIKTFTYFEPLSLSLIMVLTYVFDELYISKPLSSRRSNSEVYIVGKGYNGCPVWLRNVLVSKLNSFDHSPLISSQYMCNDRIFMDAILRSYYIFYHQIDVLRYNIDMYNRYRYDIGKLKYVIRRDKASSISSYINSTNIVPIQSCDKIVCDETLF